MRNTGENSGISHSHRKSINYRRLPVNTRKCQLRFPSIGNERIMVPAGSGACARGKEEGHTRSEKLEHQSKVHRADRRKAAKFWHRRVALWSASPDANGSYLESPRAHLLRFNKSSREQYVSLISRHQIY